MCYLKIDTQKSLELIQNTAAKLQKKKAGWEGLKYKNVKKKRKRELTIGKSTHPRERNINYKNHAFM